MIGASMAGLLAARVLSDHFGRVTLVERDRLPEGPDHRKGVPQGRHLHTLLVRGERILSRLFPAVTSDLARAGATEIDLPGDVVWFQEGGYMARFRSGITVLFMSRPLLECHVRRRVTAIDNVTCLQEHDVSRLTASPDRTRITGVKLHRRGSEASSEASLDADLVVDATGRGSRSPAWLEALGYRGPEETVVKVDVGYTTRVYKQDPDLLPHAKGIYIPPAPPRGRRGGGLFPIEGGRWMVTLGGWLGDHAPADDAGFLEYARSLPSRDLYDVIARAEPLTGFARHRLPSNLRRRYERMTRFPEGYVVMGDAICSFNPVYGQGMTVSAMQAEILDRCLAASGRPSPSRFARTFFDEAAGAIDSPWMVAAGEDFRFPEVEGPKPLGTDLINRYVSQLHRANVRDRETTRAFFQVVTMTHPPRSLFSPRIVLRVLRDRLAMTAARRLRRAAVP